MKDIMQVLYFQKKEKDAHLNIIERLFVRTEASLDNQLYDRHTIFSQYKFDTILNNQTFNLTF